MTYQALYRVWRPQSFDELVGQEMIAQTLRHAIQNHQLSHAYLFAGPRGTGKTSAAKILSKAVNCPHAHDGNPCNECAICQGITSGEIADVIEIDAASNNGVDEIRDLRDKARYAPTVTSHKVYIIDEVHMLSTGAFNALLKTLEEPPAQVLFILATTEPHKIPATILSRTQRFDFQRIKDRAMMDRMAYILEHDSVEYQEEGLAVIARAANGGMRDALSLLDQALSYNNQEVTTETALSVSGSFAQQVYADYLRAVHSQEVAPALEILDQPLQAGKQAHRFIEELVLFIRDVLVSQFAGDNQTFLSDRELAALTDQVPVRYYYQLIDHLNQAQQQMRLSNQPEVYLQVMTVQIAQGGFNEPANSGQAQAGLDLSSQVKSLQEQVAALQHQLKGQGQLIEALRERSHQDAPPTQQPEAKEVDSTASDQPLVPRQRPNFVQGDYHLDLASVYRVLNQAGRSQLQQLRDQWPLILQALTPVQRVKFPRTTPIAAGEGAGLIAFEDRQFCAMIDQDQALQDQVNNVASHQLGRRMELVYLTQEEWPAIRQEYKERFDQSGGQPVTPPGQPARPSQTPDQAVQEPASAKDLPHASQLDAQGEFQPEETAPGDGPEEPADDLFAQSQNRLVDQEEADQAPVIQQAPGQLGMFDQVEEEAHEGEESAPDPLIEKALELFGQDHVVVHFDEKS